MGKCGGLPLAIVILSGVLLHKKTYTFCILVRCKGPSLEKVEGHIFGDSRNTKLELGRLVFPNETMFSVCC